MPESKRHFVTVNGRQLHFRVCGEGPAMLLMHQAPQNSRMWQAMLRRFGERYTVLAPDIPGFGHSEVPLGNPQTIAEFGAAILAWLDAIGVERFAAFGMHTGGLIATWLAWAYPKRVAALVVDGYAAFTPEESELYGRRYLPPFEPHWDGAHLTWLWARMREQKYFFPWYDGRAEAAMRIDPHTTESTHEAVMDVLDVGDRYRAGYAAAFRHNQHHWLRELKVPSWLVYRHTDPLRAHLRRLQHLPQCVAVVEENGGIDAMHRRMDAWLAGTLAREPGYRLPPPAVSQHGWCRRIIATPVGELACWQHDGCERLRVRLQAPGTCLSDPHDIDVGSDAWLLPALPGHGGSSEIEALPDRDTVTAALLAAIAAAGDSLPIELEARAAAAGYVPGLVRALGSRVRGVTLHDPWLLEAGEQRTLLERLPVTRIQRAGGHLGDTWQWERERHLLWPWLAPSAAARRGAAAPTPAVVHANVVELLRLGPRLEALFRGATPPGLADDLAALRVPLRVAANPESDFMGRAAALAARHDQGTHA